MRTLERIERLQTILDQPTIPLDAPLTDDPDAATLGDLLPAEGPTPEEQMVARCRRQLVIQGFRVLTDRERAILGLRFADWSLRDVAGAMDLSRERVRQLESHAVETMRAAVLESTSGAPQAAQEAAGGYSLDGQPDGAQPKP